jgi:ABC-2 type transport system permease protein
LSGAGPAYLDALLDFGLIALLGLGLALIMRHTGAAITAKLALLYVAPTVALFVSDPLWQERIRRYAPTTADVKVLAAYAGAAVLAGAVVFARRDA